jgi:hypothetical protein
MLARETKGAIDRIGEMATYGIKLFKNKSAKCSSLVQQTSLLLYS